MRGSASGLTNSSALELVAGQADLAGRAQAGDLLGAALAAGDLDGHGHDDLAIGAPGQDIGQATNAGEVLVVGGSANGLAPASSRLVRAGKSGVAGRSERDDVFGTSLAIGDVNGTGTADLVVGAPGEDAAVGRVNDGALVVVPGTEEGLVGEGSRQFWSGSNGSAGVSQSNDLLGASVAVGDVEADGQVEILAGAPGKDVGAVGEAGAVLVIGSQDGVLTSDSPNVAGSSEADDRFGRSVATGDFNGDGVADLVAAAPTETAAGAAATGAVTVVPGAAEPAEAGLTGAGSVHLVRGLDGLAGTAKVDDHFGGLLPPYLF